MAQPSGLLHQYRFGVQFLTGGHFDMWTDVTLGSEKLQFFKFYRNKMKKTWNFSPKVQFMIVKVNESLLYDIA